MIETLDARKYLKSPLGDYLGETLFNSSKTVENFANKLSFQILISCPPCRSIFLGEHLSNSERIQFLPIVIQLIDNYFRRLLLHTELKSRAMNK